MERETKTANKNSSIQKNVYLSAAHQHHKLFQLLETEIDFYTTLREMTGHTPTVRKVSTTVARPLGVPFQWKDVASYSKARIPVTRKAYLKLEDAVLII
jgi:hypothetical protein